MRVLITGGNGDIGNAIVNEFVDDTAISYISSPTSSELDLSFDYVDLTTHTEYDIIINCAGINIPTGILSDNDEIILNRMMNVNFHSPRKIIKNILPYMISNNYGRIINVGSILQDFAKPGRNIYSSTKSALHSLTKSIAVEYGKYNILCNTVSPGYINTKLTTQNNTIDEIDLIKNKIPLYEMGEVSDIAKLVKFLTLDNNYITGQNIIIDGGITCTI